MATSESGGRYFWSEVAAAQAAFNNRRGNVEIAFLLPYLKPGLRVVDLGCGAGSITCDVAEIVAPGAVCGVDISDAAITSARSLARERGLANAAFQVGDAADTGLPSDGFDVVVICVMLSYLSEPERAVAEAFRLLAPGGMIGVREMMKEGDWFAGPHTDVLEVINQTLIEGIRGRGGDPFFGKRIKQVLHEAGFVGVDRLPRYSQTFSSPTRVGDLYVSFLNSPAQADKLAALGIATDAQRAESVRKVQEWAADSRSVVATAEFVAWGEKPT